MPKGSIQEVEKDETTWVQYNGSMYLRIPGRLHVGCPEASAIIWLYKVLSTKTIYSGSQNRWDYLGMMMTNTVQYNGSMYLYIPGRLHVGCPEVDADDHDQGLGSPSLSHDS